jgi:DNA mismatch repair protein MutL
LNHAVSAAYGNTMARGRHPAVFVFVELDPASVDVNVHPQKTEVRFRRSGEVHDLLRDALHAALGEPTAVPRLEELRSTSGQPQAVQFTGRSYELREPTVRPAASPADGSPDLPRRAAAPPPPAELGIETADEAGENGTTSRTDAGAHVVPLAQFRDSYIVAQDSQGLMLVDQHAAHERVLFERYLEEAERNRVEVQQLLFPVTVELATHEKLVFDEELDEFRRLGFRAEPFGAQTVRLDGVPAVAAEVDPESLLRELLGEAAGARSASADVGALRHRLVTSAACQAAIKIHHPLSRPEMQRLLDDLFSAVSPTTCPHGRPVVFRLSLEEIERAFRRR